jgi:hypothetical protein
MRENMMKKAAGLIFVSAFVTACGGGGGGGGSAPGATGPSGTSSSPAAPVTPPAPPPPPPAPEVKVVTASVARVAAQNTSVNFDVQIKPNNFTPAGTLFVTASDPSNVVGPQVSVVSNTDGSYTLSLGSLTAAAAGHYTGNITLKLCADQACATPQAVPSVTVPYDLTVMGSGTAWPGDNLTPLAAWTDVPEWSTFQGNAAHTGYVPVTINPDQIKLRWKSAAISQTAQSNWGYGYSATMAIGNGMFYGAGANVLKARKEFDGSVAWTYDLSALQYPSVNPPAFGNGIVYMAGGQQQSTYMFAFDAASGAVSFKTPMSSQWENYLAPVVLDDAVYTDAGTYGGLYAFKPTGEQLFSKSLAQVSMWSPAVDATSVYVYDGTLHVMDRKTGTVTSEIKNPDYQNYIYQSNGAPVLGASGSVFAADYANAFLNSGTLGNQLLKFNTAKGYVDWRINGNYPLTPAYAKGVVYAVNLSPYRIEARNESDGALAWSWTPGQAAETKWSGEPVVTGNLLFTSTNLATYAIDLSTHKVVWSYPAAGRLALSRSGILYIQNSDAVVAVNLK